MHAIRVGALLGGYREAKRGASPRRLDQTSKQSHCKRPTNSAPTPIRLLLRPNGGDDDDDECEREMMEVKWGGALTIA